jgi:hypothetical protein
MSIDAGQFSQLLALLFAREFENGSI